MLMFGPNPVSPIWLSPPIPRLLRTRMSVETTSPLSHQLLRLNDAAIPVGPTNVVGQWPSSMHGVSTTLLVSVSHL